MGLVVDGVTNGCHIVENDCFIQRASGWMLKLEDQSVHVRDSEWECLIRDVNGVLVGALEEGLEYCCCGRCDVRWKEELGV